MLCIKLVDIRQMFKKKTYPNFNAGSKVPLSDCSPEGKEIIELLNKYREENGLPKIPKSCSLCTVANTKVLAACIILLLETQATQALILCFYSLSY